jgi:hypothetical protein
MESLTGPLVPNSGHILEYFGKHIENTVSLLDLEPDALGNPKTVKVCQSFDCYGESS